MLKKLNILLLNTLIFSYSFGMYKTTIKNPQKYQTEVLKVDKTLDISDKTITVRKNNILEIIPFKMVGKLILNKNSKIILKENSQLILKGIILQGISVQDNFEFGKNSKVIYNELTGFITEILDGKNPPLTKRPFFQTNEYKEYFEFKRDSLY